MVSVLVPVCGDVGNLKLSDTCKTFCLVLPNLFEVLVQTTKRPELCKPQHHTRLT